MVHTLTTPSYGAGICELADHVELRALQHDDRNSSIQDLVQALKRSGSVEDSTDDDEETQPRADKMVEPPRSAAEDVFDELDDRKKACGRTSGLYPFELTQRTLSASADHETSVYVFLLLLTQFGRNAGPNDLHGERLFEQLCKCASARFMAGTDGLSDAVEFGFPRRILPKDFPAALKTLCDRLGEGAPSDKIPRRSVHKDGSLDIVCWRGFADGRAGKLIGFGQCATGRSDWRSKRTELQPSSFLALYMNDHPPVPPTRMFFVPWRVERLEWRETCALGGVLFDRCRITSLAYSIPADLVAEFKRWSIHVLKEHRGK